MKLHKHRIPIYGGQLWVCVTKSFLGAVEELENMIDVVLESNKDRASDLRKTSAITYQFYTPDGSFRVLVLIRPKTNINTVVHESLHIVNNIFQHCGIKYSLTNDEPQCYLLGWVVDQIMNDKSKI